MKKMHPLFKSKSYDILNEGIDFEAYYELAENGLSDRDIAHEMNISESFLENIKKQAKEY
jgi:orotate phosphoribosyltransferase-like protein